MPEELTIGRLAAAAGVHVETIRYYQRRGLLKVPPKPYRGVRRYPAQLSERVLFIKRAQALGFKLDEILHFPGLDASGCCATTRALAAQRLATIEVKLAELAAMRDALAELVRRCDSGQSLADKACPIIDVLSSDHQ